MLFNQGSYQGAKYKWRNKPKSNPTSEGYHMGQGRAERLERWSADLGYGRLTTSHGQPTTLKGPRPITWPFGHVQYVYPRKPTSRRHLKRWRSEAVHRTVGRLGGRSVDHGLGRPTSVMVGRAPTWPPDQPTCCPHRPSSPYK